MKYGKIPIHWLIFIACSAVMAGLVAAKFTVLPSFALLGITALPLMLRRKWLAAVPVVLVCFSVGYLKGAAIESKLRLSDELVGQQVTVHAQISNDPVYHESGQFEFRVHKVNMNGKDAPGIFRIRTFDATVTRGDWVHVEGKLYGGFGPIRGSISYASIKVIRGSGSPFESFRSRFMAVFRSNIADPEAPLGLGFLLGTRSILPDRLSESLAATGLTHIIAVSGYNLTILVSLTRRLFSRYSRFLSVAAASALLFSFIVIAGGSPSIFRAVVVSVVSLLAWYFGRASRPMVVLWLSAAITAYLEPLYIWGDIGWYLSFFAFFGVLVLAPLVEKRIYRKITPGLIGSLAIETSMAQLATLPLIMLIFGDVSLVALLANLVVLPLIPIAMLLSFVSGAGAMLLPSLAGWLSLPAFYILRFIVQAISLMSSIPGALRSISLDAAGFILLWTIILMLWAGLAKYRRRTNTSDYEITDEKGIMQVIENT